MLCGAYLASSHSWPKSASSDVAEVPAAEVPIVELSRVVTESVSEISSGQTVSGTIVSVAVSAILGTLVHEVSWTKYRSRHVLISGY